MNEKRSTPIKFRMLGLFIIICTGYASNAQNPISATESIKIYGEIKNPMTFTGNAIESLPSMTIKDQIIYNHKGEVKDTLFGLMGVPLKTLLSSIQYINDKPRDLNEFYFIFTASDDYKVVFSWNEIYNTAAGDNFFIVTEMKGKKLREMDQRILFISTIDLKSGRRYIKGLEKIEVRRVK